MSAAEECQTKIKDLEEVYNDSKSTHGEFDRATLAALHALGMLYKDQGEHNHGIDTIMRCYEARVQHLGTDDEDTLTSQQYLGEYYVFLSRAGDGVDILRKCYDVRKAADAESEGTLDCMRALGQALQAVGLVGEALNVLEQRYVTIVKQTVAKEMPDDHPCTLPSRLDFALALAGSGRYTAVPALGLASIMNAYKTVYGADNPATLKLMEQYAKLLTKMGATDQACLLLQECVQSKTATLGPNHTSTIASKFDLAGALLELGRNRELESLGLQAALHDMQMQLGETHPDTISSKVKLGALYSTMNKHKEALELFKTCYEVRCKTLGKDHELTLGIANNMAAMYDTMQMSKEARDLYETTLTLMEERLAKSHLSTTGCMINLALCYQNMGDLPKARKWYQDILEICTAAYGNKHPRTLMALDYIACVDLIEEKFAEAKETFEKSYALKREVMEETHPLCLSAMENIASCMQRLGDKEESVEVYRKLCALRESGYGAKHVDTIKARAGMAIVLAELGNGEEAINTIVACIEDTETVLGPDAAQVQEYYGVLGYMYALYGQYDEGVRFTNISLVGTIKIFGDKHFRVMTLLQRKVWMLTNAERMEEAAKVEAILNAMNAEDNPAAPVADPAADGAGGAVEDSPPTLLQQVEAELAASDEDQLQSAAAGLSTR
jgi:tetratricopeptide (TPR) repeat protein